MQKCLIKANVIKASFVLNTIVLKIVTLITKLLSVIKYYNLPNNKDTKYINLNILTLSFLFP